MGLTRCDLRGHSFFPTHGGYETCAVCGERNLLTGPRDGTHLRDFDADRLNDQMKAVWEIVKDGEWHHPADLCAVVGASDASVKARLRDFRKEKFGGFKVTLRRVPGGAFEYRVSA